MVQSAAIEGRSRNHLLTKEKLPDKGCRILYVQFHPIQAFHSDNLLEYGCGPEIKFPVGFFLQSQQLLLTERRQSMDRFGMNAVMIEIAIHQQSLLLQLPVDLCSGEWR